MTHSSFTAVTTRASSLAGSPGAAKRSSIHLMIASVKLEEAEQKRQMLKKQCETASLALTEVQNYPPKTLSEEQVREILAHQQEWETQILHIQKNISRIDHEITALSDTNEDLQMRFRRQLERNISTIQEIKHQKIELIMQALKTENPDIRYHLAKVFEDPILEEHYFNSITTPENKSFTERLKNLFVREK